MRLPLAAAAVIALALAPHPAPAQTAAVSCRIGAWQAFASAPMCATLHHAAHQLIPSPNGDPMQLRACADTFANGGGPMWVARGYRLCGEIYLANVGTGGPMPPR